MDNGIIINQIIILGFLAIIGLIASKLKVIDAMVRESIPKLVFNISLPALIFSSVAGLEMDVKILSNALYVFILSFFAISLLLIVGRSSALLLKLKGGKAGIHTLHTGFGNVAFLGYPLFSALFPNGEGLLYAVIFHLTQDIFIWSVGILVFQGDGRKNILKNMIHLLNPNTIAFLVGAIFFVFNLQLPSLIFASVKGLGQTTIYLAMLYIGAVLAINPVLSAFKKMEIYALIFNKMLLVPFIVLLIVSFLKNSGIIEISFPAATVLIMQVSMPCMAMVVVLAKKYNSDDVHATENLFVSTLFSLLTLPFIYFLITLLF